MFTEQCKRRGIKLEDIDKGWVPQHKIGEESDDEVVDEFEEDDEEIDEEDLFSRSKHEKPSSKASKEDDDEESSISIKRKRREPSGIEEKDSGKDESSKPKEPPKVEKPEISMAELEAMFGSSSNTPSESSSTLTPVSGSDTPNRDRISAAISNAETSTSAPKLKLNIDRSAVDPGIAANPGANGAKPKIKLNIKPKQQ